MIADGIIETLAEEAAGRRVVDARVGLRYTAVLLDDGRAGLAFTFASEVPGASDPEALEDLPAYGVLEGLRSGDPLRAVLGCACANALIDAEKVATVEGDAFELLDIRPGDRVGMVGYFPPVIRRLSGGPYDLLIFERRPVEGTYPDWSERRLLPGCDVVIVTGTAVINGTIDSILEWSAGVREVAVIGPSTPLIPHLYPAQVKVLGGAVVTSPRKALRAVSIGGGLRALKPFIKMISVIRREEGRS